MSLNFSYGKFVGTLAVFEIEESTHFCAAAWMSTCCVGRDVISRDEVIRQLLAGSVEPRHAHSD